MDYVARGATISECGQYRYRLWRYWSHLARRVLFVMLNPSTANALEDDATIRRCVGFADGWGYCGIEVVNLFAFRSTDPKALAPLDYWQAVGMKNDVAIEQAVHRVLMFDGLVIAAWGAHGALHDREQEVVELINRHGDVYALGTTKDGHPKHPLYLAADTEPVIYRRKSA